MDPDANWSEQLRIAYRILTDWDRERDPSPQDAYRLAELAEALDDWIASGGHLPKLWRRRRWQ